MFITYYFYFIIYAFLGYICEVVYVSIGTRKLTNRGYLYGPICPIYGYGAVIILFCLRPVYDRGMWYLVFLLGVLLTSTLEYLTSYVMELIFHMRWWDYSDYKFNINGRVCLKNSLLFGALVMLVFYVIQPGVDYVLGLITSKVVWYSLFWILLALHMVDTVFSTIKHINISKLMAKLTSFVDDIGEKLEEKSNQLKEYFSNTKIAKKLQSISSHYPSTKVRSKNKKKRLSVKEMLAKIRSSDKE